jgi:hypothetical protein
MRLLRRWNGLRRQALRLGHCTKDTAQNIVIACLL